MNVPWEARCKSFHQPGLGACCGRPVTSKLRTARCCCQGQGGVYTSASCYEWRPHSSDDPTGLAGCAA